MSVPVLRNRFSSDIQPEIYARGSWTSDPTFLPSFVGDWVSFRRYDHIIDVVGTPKTQRVKPVTHDKARYDGISMQPFVADHGYVVTFRDDAMPNIDIVWILEQERFSLPHVERVQANLDAFNAFAERFPAKISFAEFAQGLTELKALLPKIGKSVERTLASNFLTWKFGWENLISDLSLFTTLASSIRQRMEFLKKTSGKPVRLFYRKNDLVPRYSLDFPDGVEGWSHDFTNGRSWCTRVVLRHSFVDYRASATLRQDLSHIDDLIGWLRAIVLSLGLNNLINSAWKTSRLSFVIDWFFNISGHLVRTASIQPAERWDVYDVTNSVGGVWLFDVYQLNEDVIDGPVNPVVYLGPLTVSRYQREVGLPLDLSVFTPSSMSPDQLELMAAMFAAK